LIKLEQSAEAFVTLDATSMCRWSRDGGRVEQLIAFALMGAFKMIMLKELSNGGAQRHFTKEDHLR
jgi:hypothetical protein